MSKMGEALIEAMQEMLDHAEGKIELRTTHFNLNPVCEKISVDEIKETRKILGVSQGVFAVVLGVSKKTVESWETGSLGGAVAKQTVSKKTVESWETGRYMPDGAARRLITMIKEDPTLPKRHGILLSRVESE